MSYPLDLKEKIYKKGTQGSTSDTLFLETQKSIWAAGSQTDSFIFSYFEYSRKFQSTRTFICLGISAITELKNGLIYNST